MIDVSIAEDASYAELETVVVPQLSDVHRRPKSDSSEDAIWSNYGGSSSSQVTSAVCHNLL
ncbi:hypothetical protein ColLi_02920 [Colletotrichum liriopes]|uniref:Uncharacterized protein n=1 Tax=Colletotrichum liriopes TaxID=708192 RepID=A0AA37LQ63_9PEZI|nr:hypothetical protein ColLi_02920 [Colletotrichum liriopes]